jgi:branched-chain amino acid transport system ATP-binding protein
VTAVIEARGLTAGYGDLAAVRDLDLEVHPGELVALLGPNGAGKTTTLLTLAGWLKPLSGTILWRGRESRTGLHQRAREGMALVPETKSVFMGLSAEANLRLGRGSPERAYEIFPALRHLRLRRAGLLSGGEQQMLTMARALAGEPALLLADELSLGLAPIVVRRLLDTVREAADRGVGVLLVEQNTRHALSVCDRAYVLRRGRIVLSGTAAELREREMELTASYLSALET